MPALDANGAETQVIELTPPGRGAVAVVLVAGQHATRIVSDAFTSASGRQLSAVPIGRIVFGRWNAPYDAAGEELVVCRRSPERVEIHCHGGNVAVGVVVDSLVGRGCRQVTWQAWTASESHDPVQAAARIALAEAPTARTAAILLDQFHGALSTELQNLRASALSGDWPRAVAMLDAMLQHAPLGTHLTRPWRVVLTGRTNVGKSSLINALAGFERAIVSPQPGTTRDVVTTATAVDGWPVLFADTAGLRETDDPLESAGVQLAMSILATADLIIAVDDAAEPAPANDFERFTLSVAQRPAATPMIHVRNKLDLIAESDRKTACALAADAIFTSAITGAGIAELIVEIGHVLVPCVPTLGSPVPFTAEQVAILEAARAAAAIHDAPKLLAALQPLLATQ